MLVRRHRDTGELAFYRCYCPNVVPFARAGSPCRAPLDVEESFQAAKGLDGLDEHQVRRWSSWRRWTLLAMTTHALLAAIAAQEHTDRRAPAGMIALTCNEIGRLFTIFVIAPSRTPTRPQSWSDWRRRHQYQARTSHCWRQNATHEWS